MSRHPRLLTKFLFRVHEDQRGAISLMSLFAVFMFTVLLGQMMNIGRQMDDKLRMQNAADAAAYTGSVGVARGMNAVAFSNHLMCEAFALTAYMREARDRHSDQFVPQILAAWKTVGERYANHAQTQKFQGMGQAILDKIPIEQAMVDNFTEMAYHQSRVTLPVFEYLLIGPNGNPQQPMPPDPEGGFIPRFQRAVVQNAPYLSYMAADDQVQRYGQTTQNLHQNQPLRALFWRTNTQVAGLSSEIDPQTRTIPAVDPSPTGPDYGGMNSPCYYCISRTRRSQLAHQYLDMWINERQVKYFGAYRDHSGWTRAKMSNYINLFRVFSCAQLDKLLNEEYPDTNLPQVLREIRAEQLLEFPDCNCSPTSFSDNDIIAQDYQFISTSYWPQLSTMMPGLFQNPLQRGQRTYAVTFAQAEVYIPRARYQCCPWEFIWIDPVTGKPTSRPNVENWPPQWDLFNQNWTVRLVPATHENLPTILQTHPQNFVNGLLSNYQAPTLGNSVPDFRLVNTH